LIYLTKKKASRSVTNGTSLDSTNTGNAGVILKWEAGTTGRDRGRRPDSQKGSWKKRKKREIGGKPKKAKKEDCLRYKLATGKEGGQRIKRSATCYTARKEEFTTYCAGQVNEIERDSSKRTFTFVEKIPFTKKGDVLTKC